MNKALRFRRKLAWTWVAVAVVLLVAFYYAIRVAGEAMNQERWVAHTQEVLKVIADGRLKRARVTNYLLTFQMKPESNMDANFGADVRGLKEDLELEGRRAELGHTMLLLFRRAFLCLSLSFASSFVLKLLEVIPGAGMTVRWKQESGTEFSDF